MSRRNTRQGKARRRAQRDRGQVTERERRRPEIPDQEARAVEDQAAQAAPRPDASGPPNSGERSFRLPSAGGGLIAADADEADLGADADLDDFGDLDPDEVDLQAMLADEDLVVDLGDVGEVVGDLLVDVDVPEGPDGPGSPD